MSTSPRSDEPSAPILPTIASPADVKKLSIQQLERLAGEIRQTIFNSVRANGGHLASNLGVVELTLALHYCYDLGPHPTGPDRLLFDVGHQCYPHKMLTGRAGDFANLRKKGHVGGFPMPDESPYDLFNVGHAGTAISTAVGMARGDQTLGLNSKVVALVGDASIVNGLALEGLNNAGTLKRQLLIILNDNGMSISEPQGAFSEYLERVRVSTTYEQFKRFSEKLVHKLPTGASNRIEQAWDAFTRTIKGYMWSGASMFETLGLKYMGPLDGHDLPGLVNFLAEIKHVDRPVLLHVKTTKGKGYEPTIKDPTKLHSPGAFSIEGGDGPELVGCRIEIKSSGGKSWTTAFADACIAVAKEDPRVHALTAAMPDGTGLSKFEKELPGQYHDTGICESHLVAMAAGMAKSGLKPVASIYSTFIQRAFDQVWQEVVLNKLPVVFCMDRAGFVGDDGAVHHGFCDQSFLRPLPDIVLMAPSDEADLNRMLRLALTLDVASAIRYPRDTVPAHDYVAVDESNRVSNDAPQARDAHPGLSVDNELRLGISRTLRTGTDATIIVYGALMSEALKAADALAKEGTQVELIDARFCQPLDATMLKRTLRLGHAVLTLEDHVVTNGFGSAVLEHAVKQGLPTAHLTLLGHPAGKLIAHAKRAEQLAETGLDAVGIAKAVRGAIASTGTVESLTR
ncbi:MAG: 1-deoxy-D-xylulose-5-phosphate synthase [Tepidisphaeraceae bacterium]